MKKHHTKSQSNISTFRKKITNKKRWTNDAMLIVYGDVVPLWTA